MTGVQTCALPISLTADLQYARAIAKFSRLLPQFEAAGDRVRVAQIQFWMGYCYEKQGRLDAARAFYRSVVQGHRGTAAARQARGRLERLDASKRR